MSSDFELPHGWCWETIDTLKAPGRSIVSGPFGSNIGKRFFVDHGVPVIRGNNLSLGMERFNDDGFVFLTEEKAEEFKSCEAHPNDLLFTAAGTIGQVGIVPPIPKYPKYIISNKQLRARLDPERIHPLFAYYWLASPPMMAMIQSRNTGSTIPLINLSVLKSLPVPVPPIEVQRAIVEILSSLDDRITLLRETNATLEAIAQALFKSWFVDFDPVRAKQQGRAPEGMDEATAALFPDSFEESELGLVPKGWRVAPVGEVVNVTDYVANGSFVALKQNVTLLDEPSYALYVRTTDFNSGFSGEFRYVDKSAYDFLSKSSLDGTEVIISNVGDVGTVFRPPRWLGFPMTLGSNAVALKKPEMSAFLYFHFSGPTGQHDIQSIVTGSAQLKFNKTNFRALRILLPESRCLAGFETVANALWSRVENNLAQAQTLATLRDTLLPRLISGQLRLPEAEALIEETT